MCHWIRISWFSNTGCLWRTAATVGFSRVSRFAIKRLSNNVSMLHQLVQLSWVLKSQMVRTRSIDNEITAHRKSMQVSQRTAFHSTPKTVWSPTLPRPEFCWTSRWIWEWPVLCLTGPPSPVSDPARLAPISEQVPQIYRFLKRSCCVQVPTWA